MDKDATVIAFDVIETVFSLQSLHPLLTDAGLPDFALQLWYCSMVRDGMALAVTGSYKPFDEVARAALKAVMRGQGLQPDDSIVDSIMHGFTELKPHPDVRPSLCQAKYLRV